MGLSQQECGKRKHRLVGENISESQVEKVFFLTECRQSLLLFLFCFTIFFLGAGGHLYLNDEVTNYLMVESFLRNQSDITPELPYARTFGVNMTRLPGMFHQGGFYSWYGLLEPLAAIPLYLLATAFGYEPWILIEILFYPIVTAMTCVLVSCCGRRLGCSDRVSVSLALIYGFASFAWPYSKFFNDGPLATLMVLASASYAIDEKQSYARGFLSGLFAALALLTKREMMFLVPAFLIYHRLRKHKSSYSLIYLAPILIGGAVYGYYNYVRFGSFLQFGLGHEQTLDAFRLPFLGMLGLLVSPGVGLIFYFPLVVLEPILFPYFYRKRSREAVFFALIFITTLCFYGSYRNWHGMTYWGPRYLLVSLPFLVLSLGEGLMKFYDQVLWKSMIVGLAVAGWFANLLGVLIYFQVGFAMLWYQFGPRAFWDISLWRFEYSPIPVHLMLLAGLSSPYQLEFQYGQTSPGRLDLFWLSQVGLIPVLAVLVGALITLPFILSDEDRMKNLRAKIR